MKLRNIAIAAASLGLVASASFASELYHPSNAEEGWTLHPNHMTSGLTRAQVNTSVMGAQRDGTLTWISRGYPARYPHVSAPTQGKSRGQVLEELRIWQANPVTADGLREIGGEAGWMPAHQGR